MKKMLLTGVLGLAATSAATSATNAQDPVPIGMPGPLVPAYTPLPAYGYPIAPVGGGYVMPGRPMPAQPIMYGYPPVGFPAQPFMPQPAMIMPVAYQSGMPVMIVSESQIVPMQLPVGKAGTATASKAPAAPKREAPPSHFGPYFFDDPLYSTMRMMPRVDPAAADPAAINLE